MHNEISAPDLLTLLSTLILPCIIEPHRRHIVINRVVGVNLLLYYHDKFQLFSMTIMYFSRFNQHYSLTYVFEKLNLHQ